MIGAIIGDIIGSKYEFRNIKHKNFPLISAECNYTDDTLMTIAVAKAALQSTGENFSENVVACMREIGRRFPCPKGGYGGHFRQWLFSENPKPYGSYGNGSAMRVSPCGEIADSLEIALRLAKESAEVTHNHPDGIRGAQATAAAVYLAKHGESKEGIRRYIEENFYPLNQTLEEIRPYYVFEISCQGTVPPAITAFLESTSFEDAMRNAVSLGGDSDTLADITGAVAWHYYARNGLDDTMRKLKNTAMRLLPDPLREIVGQWEETYCKYADSTEEILSPYENSIRDYTELVFILDKSGSMHGLEDDTIGGFQSMLEKQKAQAGNAFISTVLFNGTQEVIHDRVDIRDVLPMTRKEYTVGGNTALFDAIGRAIRHMESVHCHARPAHTMFVIITDGMENASRQYDLRRVREMIEEQKAKHGWEFIFLGANIDAIQVAEGFGIGANRAVRYHNDKQGTALNYEVVSNAITDVRSNQPMRDSWKEKIEEDYRKRK